MRASICIFRLSGRPSDAGIRRWAKRHQLRIEQERGDLSKVFQASVVLSQVFSQTEQASLSRATARNWAVRSGSEATPQIQGSPISCFVVCYSWAGPARGITRTAGPCGPAHHTCSNTGRESIAGTT